MWEFKILFLMVLMIMAFFSFAWAFRLTHYVGTMFGALAAPIRRKHSRCARPRTQDRRNSWACRGAISTQGFRTIYFAIAGLAWFVSPILFALACALVTVIVYRREYRLRGLHRYRSARPSGYTGKWLRDSP